MRYRCLTVKARDVLIKRRTAFGRDRPWYRSSENAYVLISEHRRTRNGECDDAAAILRPHRSA
jgi:hypothetical protein